MLPDVEIEPVPVRIPGGRASERGNLSSLDYIYEGKKVSILLFFPMVPVDEYA